jgi:hypothetical protein
MDGKLQFSNFIRPICLSPASPPINTLVNQSLTILGFGSSVDSLKISRYLNYGQMKIISRQQCTDKLYFALLPEQSTFCAIASENSLACSGESGGGMIQRVNGIYFLRGIVSVTLTEANGRCNLDNPVGFTDINAFIPWIIENVR